MLDPQDRQRFFDIRYAHPTLRRRLLRYHCKNRAGIEGLCDQEPGKPLPVAENNKEAIRDTEDTVMGEAGDINQKNGTGDECLPSTPSRSVGKVFETLNISGIATDHAL